MTNSGIAFLNENTETTPGRTVMVFGVGRGGTSAVAGMLRELGLSMGDRLHPLKHEWSPLAYSRDKVDVDASAANISSMNGRHLNWGWKSPRDVFTLEQYLHLIRNPRIVIVFRNMLDNLLSAARHEAMDLPPLANGIGQVFRKLSQVLGTVTAPTALISYEALTTNSRQVVHDVDAWLGLHGSHACLEAATRFVSGENARYRAISSDTKHADTHISRSDLDVARSATHARLYPQESDLLTERTNLLQQESESLSSAIQDLSEKLAGHVRLRYPNHMTLSTSESLESLLCEPIPVIEKTLGFNPFQGMVLPHDIEGSGGYAPAPQPADGDAWEAGYRVVRSRYKEVDRKAMDLRRVKQILEWRLRSLESAECLATTTSVPD